jgi:hypothetical protein
MTDEELDKLMQELAEQIKQLPEDRARPLSKAEKKRKLVLRARHEALDRIKAAREKGSLRQEGKAGMDYVLLTEYGDKNPLLFNFMKARSGWWHVW